MGLFGRSGKGDPFDWLVVGLGNPGPKYARTRHNVGEEAIRVLAERQRANLKGGRDNALIAETRLPGPRGDERVVLAFPITFMNESGQAVGAMVRRYRIEAPEQIIVGGGLAGHNGLRSINQHVKSTDFVRVRIGVGKPPGGKEGGRSHVLSKIPKSERELLDIKVAEAADAVEMIIASGVDAAMQRYNGRP